MPRMPYCYVQHNYYHNHLLWSIISVQFTQRIAQRVHKVNKTPFTIAVLSALKCPTPTLFSYHSMHCVLVHFLLVFSVFDATTTTHDTMQRERMEERNATHAKCRK